MTADPQRWLWAVGALALWLALIAVIVWRERRAEAQARARSDAFAGAGAGAGEGQAVLIAFASQTGFAEELAWMTARALSDGGVGARVSSFADLDVQILKATDRTLLIVSTTGEGDPPDSAARFVRKAMGETTDLSALRFGLLALGDRSYAQFCGFGHEALGRRTPVRHGRGRQWRGRRHPSLAAPAEPDHRQRDRSRLDPARL